jgi:DNA repair protein SbcD/Mre11
MRLCHVADSHLGAGENHPVRGESGLTVRQEDIIRSFVEAVDGIIDLKPDLCVHAGDLFHTVRPLNRVMAIAAEQLHRLAAVHGIPTVIIAGNHDAPRQAHVGAALDVFRKIDNLHVAASGRLEIFDIQGARVFALPHCMTAASQQEQLVLCRPDPGMRHNILVLHGVASGMPEFSMADLGEQELPIEVMEPFEYTALGHFHNWCQVAPRAWYAGSTERLSQSEREAAKGFLEVDLDPLRVSFHEVCSRPMIDLPTVDATGKRGDQVARLIEDCLASVDSTNKIVRVKVEGVSSEMLKTLPTAALAQLKSRAYALDIRFEKEKVEGESGQFGHAAIGRLDQSFIAYLETVPLEGFDRDRLIREALGYLKAEE